MVKKKISSKQALCSIININEFVMLYATFEGAMKSLFLQKGILDESASLKEKNVIILLRGFKFKVQHLTSPVFLYQVKC